MLTDLYRQLSKLISHIGSKRIPFLLGLIGRSLNLLLSTYLASVLLSNVMNAVILKSRQYLYESVLSILPLLFLIILIQAVSKFVSESACIAGVANMRSKLLDTMLEQPLGKEDAEHSGIKLSYLLNDAPMAMEGLGKTLQIPLNALFMGLGGMIYVISVDYRISLIALGLGLFTLSYSVYFSKRLRHSSDLAQSALADAGVKLKNILDGAVTARIYNMRKMLEERYDSAANDAKRAGIAFAFDSAVLGGLNNAQDHIGEKLLVFLAGLLLLNGSFDLPALVRVSQMAGGVVGVFHLSRIMTDVQKCLAAARRISSVLDAPKTEYGDTEEINPKKTDRAISFTDVTYLYPGRVSTVQIPSFTVYAGEMAVLVGGSGCGKSTALRLILGLIPVQSGRVELYGTDVSRISPASLRKQLAVVPQDIVLFPGTIEENVMMGLEDATKERISKEKIIQAAIEANAHDFIAGMEKGYDTMVTERGTSLSGGQRQRIALARAFLRNTPIILLDEATSALDPQNEALFREALLRKKGKQTLVVVTHNRAIADIADRVIYL